MIRASPLKSKVKSQKLVNELDEHLILVNLPSSFHVKEFTIL